MVERLVANEKVEGSTPFARSRIMLKLCVEGWRYINNSFAIVNQRQLLEFLKLPIYLRHKDVPYFKKSWNVSKNSNGFSFDENQKLNLIKNPKPNESFDVTYRISSPFDLGPSTSKKTYIFTTREFELDETHFKNGKLFDFNNKNNFFLAASSNWSKNGLVQYGFNESQVKVITLGVDPKVFFPLGFEKKNRLREKLRIKEEDFVLLSIGAMTENKGIKQLILAFALLRKKNKNIKLILKDQSNLYNIFAQTHIKDLKNSKYKDLIDDEIISNILFISNNLNCEQVNDLYGISDCYVSPYLAEGFGLTPLEASSAGTPIVVTKGGSTDDYFNPIMGAQISSRFIKDNNATYLKPNIDSLVENINLIINNPKNFGGKSSHSLIAKEFSVNKSVQKLLNEINI